MQTLLFTYNPKFFYPLRDYSSFVQKRVISTEWEMLEVLEKNIRRYYEYDQDFDFFHKKERLSIEKSKGLQLSAAVLRFLALNNTKRKVVALRFKGVETAKSLAELVQKMLTKLSESEQVSLYGLQLSGKILSIKRLITKAKAFLKSGFELLKLIHKNRSNDHAAKALKKSAQDVLLGLYAAPGSDVKLLESDVLKKYNEVARGERSLVHEFTGELINNETRELPVIKSKTTLWNYFSKESVKRATAKLRNGNKWYNDHYKPYVKRQAPNYALSFVSSDGQVIPFRLRIKGVDTWKRALCYFVFDVKTGVIIGYAISRTETKQVMSEAFGNMLMNTKGIRPHEVQLDNFGKSYLKELEQIFPKVSFCKPLNPQSKYAEGFIKQFEQKYCRKVKGWTGANVTTKNKRGNQRRNPDEDQKCYSITQIKAMYKYLIDQYNNEILDNASGQTRMEVLEQNINPGCKQIEETTLASLFGKTTFSSIHRGYVKIAVDSKDYYYKVPQVSVVGAQQKNGKSVRVRYLPYKLDEKIWLYNYDKYDKNNAEADTYLTEALAPTLAQAAEAEQVHEDLVALGEASRWVTQTEADDDEAAADISSFIDPDEVVAWSDDPEAVMSAGYTEKDLMQQAEEQALKAQVKEAQKTQSKKQKAKSKPGKESKKAAVSNSSANRWNSWAK